MCIGTILNFFYPWRLPEQHLSDAMASYRLYLQRREKADLEESLQLFRAAYATTRAGHRSYPIIMVNYAAALMESQRYTGVFKDETILGLLWKAEDVLRAGRNDAYYTVLNNIGNVHISSFRHTQNASNLDAAHRCFTQVINELEELNPSSSRYFDAKTGKATVILAPFEKDPIQHAGDASLGKVDDAIALLKAATEHSRNKNPPYFAGLASAYYTRYQLANKGTRDLDSAIEYNEQALDLLERNGSVMDEGLFRIKLDLAKQYLERSSRPEAKSQDLELGNKKLGDLRNFLKDDKGLALEPVFDKLREDLNAFITSMGSRDTT